MKTAIGFRPRKKTLGKLGERLLADGLIADDKLRTALEQQRKQGGFLGETLVNLGFLRSAQLKPYLEDITGFPFVEISEVEVDPDVYTQFPEALVTSRQALPFREEDGHIYLAMVDPLNLAILDEFKATTDKSIVPCLALGNDLNDVIRRIYDVRHKTRSLLDEIAPTTDLESNDLAAGLLDQAEQAPIVRLVKNIILGAITVSASDIHIEPQEGNVRVRYRIDGVLYEQMTFPFIHHSAVVSRLKILAGMDIGERRRPQDGRFSTNIEGQSPFDVRMSIMPTVYGEKACLRLLEKSNSFARLDKLGLFPDQRAAFEKFIHHPYGLVLVTGPTGCGKTTTLYAALQSISDTTVNVNTIEDPVEYRLAGVNQMQVNNKVGVTFANGLRSLVRQDPDIIFVGEIRDGETAEIAVQAALTGHLVLSTLHTNDAAGALVRLQHMGVEPFLISSSVVGVVAQRLARTLCIYCRETYEASAAEMVALGLPQDAGGIRPTLARPKGCKRCGGRGTKGRTAIIEIMPMSDAIRSLVLSSASGHEIAAQATLEGFSTMRQAAARKALELVIAPEELTRIFAEAE